MPSTETIRYDIPRDLAQLLELALHDYTRVLRERLGDGGEYTTSFGVDQCAWLARYVGNINHKNGIEAQQVLEGGSR